MVDCCKEPGLRSEQGICTRPLDEKKKGPGVGQLMQLPRRLVGPIIVRIDFQQFDRANRGEAKNIKIQHQAIGGFQ